MSGGDCAGAPGRVPEIEPGTRSGNTEGRSGSSRANPAGGPPGDASAERLFAWRTWACYGRELLAQRFKTPELAGVWRRENFPGADDAPLTLVAVEGDHVSPPLPSELAAAHLAWLHEEAAGGPGTRTAA